MSRAMTRMILPALTIAAACVCILGIRRVQAQDDLPASCRDGVSRTEIERKARDSARFNGLWPSVPDSEIEITSLEALTAEEHDERYPDISLMGGIPVVEPHQCVWRAEVTGTGAWCGGRATSRCALVNWMAFGFMGATGNLKYESIDFLDDVQRVWLPLVASGR